MNVWLHNWIAGLTAAAVTAAAAELLTPPGPVEKVTRFVCGIMLVAVLLGPLASVDREAFSLSLSDYRDTVAELTGDMEQQQNRLVRSYIEQECAAYILDEAQVLGVAGGRVEVSAKWGDECWVPYEAYLDLEATGDQRNRLSVLLDVQLGIPAERQHWNDG